jgi:hypothetical protein
MATIRVDMRLNPELVAWVDAYAEERLSNRTAIVTAALLNFREEAETGVPELDMEGVGRAQRELNARRAERREAAAGLEQASGSPARGVGTSADASSTVASASARAPRSGETFTDPEGTVLSDHAPGASWERPSRPKISAQRVEAMRRAAARKGS